MRRLSSNLLRRAKPICRLGAWLFQVALLVWFTAYSVGLPMALTALRSSSSGMPALVTKDGCQCSMKKKLSGTCCCSRSDTASKAEANPQTAATPAKAELPSCCAKRQAKAVAKTVKAARSCCSSKVETVARSTAPKSSCCSSKDGASLRANDRCGCNSSGDWELNSLSMLALPVGDSEPVICATVVEPIAPQSESWPSLRHEPPEPPPRA